MASSLSNLVNNLSKGIHRIKCKQEHDDEKYKYCDNLIEDKCLCCNKLCQRKFDEMLKEQFFNTYKFSNYGNDKGDWMGVY